MEGLAVDRLHALTKLPKPESNVMRGSLTLPGVRAGSITVLAIACGVMVGNIYLCQPLLAQIAQQFGIAEKAASLVAVATQVGYALGVLLIVRWPTWQSLPCSFVR